MDRSGERYHWVLENNIQHIVTNQVVNPATFEPVVAVIDIPDESKDLTLFLLRWA